MVFYAGVTEDGDRKRYGKDMTVEEVVKEICKDEIFFFHSGEVLKDVEIPDMEMLKKMAEVIRAEDPEAAVKVKVNKYWKE